MPDLISLPQHEVSRGHPEDSKNLIAAYSGMTDYNEINNAYIYRGLPHTDMRALRITADRWC
jgi:hypothetical protein